MSAAYPLAGRSKFTPWVSKLFFELCHHHDHLARLGDRALCVFSFWRSNSFVTIIEFKLTTLAGFVLVPFALWNKTSFLAERVLGNVIASGVKLMVLAIIIRRRLDHFWNSITSDFHARRSVTLEEAAATILGSLSLLALGIFGPRHCDGPCFAGAPQLGRGRCRCDRCWNRRCSDLGAGALGGAGARAAANGYWREPIRRARRRLYGGRRECSVDAWQSSVRSVRFARRSSRRGRRRPTALSPPRWQSARSSASRAFGDPGDAFNAGSRAAFTATGGKIAGSSAVKSMAPANAAPDWAQKLRREQGMRDAGLTATHVISSAAIGPAALTRRALDRMTNDVQALFNQLWRNAAAGNALHTRADKSWDQRMGSALVPGRQLAACRLCFLFSSPAFLLARLIWQSNRSIITPYVVEVDMARRRACGWPGYGGV